MKYWHWDCPYYWKFGVKNSKSSYFRGISISALYDFSDSIYVLGLLDFGLRSNIPIGKKGRRALTRWVILLSYGNHHPSYFASSKSTSIFMKHKNLHKMKTLEINLLLFNSLFENWNQYNWTILLLVDVIFSTRKSLTICIFHSYLAHSTTK